MPDHHQAFEGKTELFQKKVPKKGPKTGSGGMLLLGTISQFFRDFPGFPKIQVEMTGAGKVSVDGAYQLTSGPPSGKYTSIQKKDNKSQSPP